VIDYTNHYYYNLFREMYDAVKVTRLRDVKLVWVDEAMFTFNTFSTRAWSAKHQSIEVNDADIRIKTMAFLGAISDNGGLEAYTIHPHAITTKEFVEFVEILSAKFHGQDFAIFMDNLQVHKTKDVLETCKRLKARPIFNVPYSPDFNGIETYFSLLKGEYKKLILERLIKGVKVDSQSLIMQSIQKVE
jgi:transposase